MIKIKDHNTGNTHKCYDVSVLDKKGDVKLLQVYVEKLECYISVVYYYVDDILFTPFDWQGYQPKFLDDINEIYWIDNMTGQQAVIINNMPRKII